MRRAASLGATAPLADPAANIRGRKRRTAMRTSDAFVLGAIGGAVAAWLWGRELGDYVGDRTRGVRSKAADGVRAVEEKTEHALRRADELLRGAKDHVTGALRTAQDTIRPALSPEVDPAGPRSS